MTLSVLATPTSFGGDASHAEIRQVHSVVDLQTVVQQTSPYAIGFGSSTYGATPLSSAAQSDAERRLDARYVRLPVGYRNGRVTTSAAGTSGTLDVPELVALYRSWGFRILVVIGGRTNDVDVQPGDATHIIKALGTGPDIDYSAPNEPNNLGLTMEAVVATAKMILEEGRAIDPGFKLWGPVWSWYHRPSLQTFATEMGTALGGVDYHHYAMGTTSISTAEAMQGTPGYGHEVREIKADLAAAGRDAPVNIDELNFSWRYQDGTPGGNNRFFTAVNTVWMASALGHILQAGGRGMPYASQNGPLGITVEAGQVNPDGREPSTPMPAYWGIAAWTGAKVWPHYGNTVYSTTSDDTSTEVFAVSNEAGGYNVVVLNKSEFEDKQLQLDFRSASAGTFSAYQSDPAAPYDQPRRIVDGTYEPGVAEPIALPRMSLTVLVLTPGTTSPPAVAAPPSGPVELSATRSQDGTTATLSWQPPTGDGGSPVTGYIVARDGSDTTGGGSYSATLAATARDFTFTLLDPSQDYTVTVQAINAAGPGPAAEAVLAAESLVAPPGPPTSVTAVREGDGSSVTVTWQQPADDGGSPVTGYTVARDGSDTTGGGSYTTTLAATAREYTFSLLDPSQDYTITVQANNTAGPGPTAQTVASAEPVVAPPGPPTSLTAVRKAGGSRVTVAWQAPDFDGGSQITGYRVTQVGPEGTYAMLVGADRLSSTFRVDSRSTYHFSVQAANAAGTGTAATVTSPGR